MTDIPSKLSEWKKAVDNCSSDIGTIHDFGNPESGSKIGQDQFLALRVLWKGGRHRDLIGPEGKKGDFLLKRHHYEKAKKDLGKDEYWQQYLNSFNKPLEHWPFPRMGTFSLVRHHQFLCHNIKPVDIDASSPKISTRTRSATALVKRIADMRLGQGPDSPSPHSSSNQIPRGVEPQTPMGKDQFSRDEYGSSARSAVSSTFTCPSPAPDGTAFPAVEDEQIVNAALLNFLTAITLHFEIPASWSFHRQAFELGKNGIKVFEARVDGYLCSSNNKHIKAIIEVKASSRKNGLAAIRRQESAQMAAWIANYPNPTKQAIYR